MFKLPDQLDVCLGRLDSEEERKTLALVSVKDPLKYFCPHIGQENYIKKVVEAVSKSKISTVLLTCANGWGKTTTSIHILLNIVYGAQNGWFDYPIFHNFPYPKLIWYVTTSTALKNVIIPEIEKLAKPGTYKTDKQGKPTVSMIKFDNGWQINFFTTDQGVEQFESATVGLIVCDEPVEEPIYKALKSRKRMGNLMLMPMTPLDCAPFVIDDIVSTAGNGVNHHITGSVYEASKANGVGEHCGVRGHLDKDIIDTMVSEYDLDEKEARVYGRFMYFSERILSNFKEERTVVSSDDFPVDYDNDYILQVVDPHDGRESACCYMAYQKSGRVVLFAETPVDFIKPFWELKRQISIPDEVRTWHDIEVSAGIRVANRIIDKRFGWQKRGGTTLCKLFLDAGNSMGARFIFIPSYNNSTEEGEISYGHKIMRTFLENFGDGYSRLVIWNSCRHTINGIKHYVRKKPRTTTELNRAADESKIIEKYKDFPDVLRYGLVELDNYSYTINAREKRNKIKKKSYSNYTSDPLLAAIR